MNKKHVIKKTEWFVKNTLRNDSSGHDWWHIERVRRNALYIGKHERVDLFVVELAALLHDIADWKFHGGTTEAGAKKASEWLRSLHVDEEIVKHIAHIVAEVSFKGAGVKSKIESIEGKVVQDADRLDALGAIGIARCFTYGGYSGVGIYDPQEKPELHKTFEDYKKSNKTSISHFYEKLLLLKDLMNTKTGKKLAVKRHRFMETYLREFYDEWNIKA